MNLIDANLFAKKILNAEAYPVAYVHGRGLTIAGGLTIADIAKLLDEMPTVDAIPIDFIVEFKEDYCNAGSDKCDIGIANALVELMLCWEDEQEGIEWRSDHERIPSKQHWNAKLCGARMDGEGMDDLISRQAAIDALEEPYKVSDTWTDEYAIGERRQWEKDVKALNSLPSAQHWIPVSERLPEGEALCCNKRKNMMLGYVLSDGDSDTGFSADSDHCYMYDVVAWMELPEPYKGS